MFSKLDVVVKVIEYSSSHRDGDFGFVITWIVAELVARYDQ